MSLKLVSRNPDLMRIRDDGYEIDIIGVNLVIHSVPYLNDKKEVRYGILVSTLELADDVTQRPSDHKAYFSGERPFDEHGRALDHVIHSNERREIGRGLATNFMFSCKPENGYADYYDKMTTYVALLSSHAQVVDPTATARTNRLIEIQDPDSVFNYLDTATSRSGTTALSRKLEMNKVAIIGVGGTGSYALDFVTKTPVREIHIFDGDRFLQHNAFRAPGAASNEDLRPVPYKVEYLAAKYSAMRKGIVPHPYHVNASNADLLAGFDFVFVCMEGIAAKKAIVEKLESLGIAFVDVGMGLEIVEDRLIGIVRTTLSTKEKRDHLRRHGVIPEKGNGEDNIYAANIQIAELNALNAALAVIKWKKHLGFYADLEREFFSAYTIDGNTITNDEKQ